MKHPIVRLMGATALALVAVPALADRSDKLAVSQMHDKIAAARGEPGVAQNGSAELDRAELALAPLLESLKDNDIKAARSITGQIDTLIETARVRARTAALKREIVTLDAAVANRTGAAEDATVRAQDDADRARAETAQLRAQTSQLQAELRDYQLKQTALGATLVLSDVVFASGGSDLKPGTIERLRPLANYLQANKSVNVQIDGHTDGQGSDAANQALSERRATAVGALLVSTGIDGVRIKSIGHGESEPVADNATPAGRQQNRRVELTLVGQQLSSVEAR